jgi:very-short-patch-repair endonuclease
MPFRRVDAVGAGLSDSVLRGPDFVQLFHGVYVHGSVALVPKVWVAAALAVHPPSAYASHHSAGRLYELPVPLHGPEHVTVRSRSDRRRTGEFRHHLMRPGARVRLVDGIRASAPDSLFCELAEHLGLVDLVVAGDHLVRWHGLTLDRLASAAAIAQPKVRRLAVRAAGLVRREVDSAMETRVRMLLVLAGLPEPQVNVAVRWPDGRVRYRFDLCYPAYKVIVEYDGRQHRADLDQWDHDIGRRDWMDAEGWSFVPVVARGVYRRPDETLDRVAAALTRAGAVGLPREYRAEWRQHFAVLP